MINRFSWLLVAYLWLNSIKKFVVKFVVLIICLLWKLRKLYTMTIWHYTVCPRFLIGFCSWTKWHVLVQTDETLIIKIRLTKCLLFYSVELPICIYMWPGLQKSTIWVQKITDFLSWLYHNSIAIYITTKISSSILKSLMDFPL